MEVVLKNDIFEFNTLTRFAPPYNILFMADLEEKMLETYENKPMIWWRYIDAIFFIWEHAEEP